MAKIEEARIPKVVPVAAIRKIEQERNGTITEASRIEVNSLADSDVANVILRKLTAAIKLVNEKFHEILAPQNEALRQTRELRAEILAPLEEGKRNLTERLMAWRREEQERINQAAAEVEAKRREREKLEKAHAKEHHKPPGPAPVIQEPAPLAAKDTTKIRKIWEFEIINADAVPDEYKVIDETLIRKAIRAAKRNEDNAPDIEIPGVTIFLKETPIFA